MTFEEAVDGAMKEGYFVRFTPPSGFEPSPWFKYEDGDGFDLVDKDTLQPFFPTEEAEAAIWEVFGPLNKPEPEAPATTPVPPLYIEPEE